MNQKESDQIIFQELWKEIFEIFQLEISNEYYLHCGKKDQQQIVKEHSPKKMCGKSKDGCNRWLTATQIWTIISSSFCSNWDYWLIFQMRWELRTDWTPKNQKKRMLNSETKIL